MSLAAESFKKSLEKREYRYSYLPENEEHNEMMRLTFSADNKDHIEIIFFFDEDGNRVNVKCFSIAKVPDTALMNVYVKLNELNEKYRWVKFYIDSDNEVTVSGDAIIDDETAGEECFEICARYIGIIDECYPELMKAMWS